MASSWDAFVALSLFLVLNFSKVNGTVSNVELLHRFQELEARLQARIEENERECDRKVAALEQQIRELGSQNAELSEENRRHKEKIDLLTRQVVELLKAEKEEIDTDVNSGDNMPSPKRKHHGQHSTKQHGAKRRQRGTVGLYRRAVGGETQIAFTAYLDHDLNNLGTDQVLPFNRVLLNDGHGYNNYTGTFTAPVPGVYSFTYFIGQRDAQEAVAYLVVNGKHQVDAAVEGLHATQDLQGGNTANLRLSRGDSVYVTHQGIYRHVEGADNLRTTSFSGFLIYVVDSTEIVG